jgi:hypothetical protein
MENSSLKGKREKEVADKAQEPEMNDMENIRLFLRKKQLENKILKQLTDEMLTKISDNVTKSKTA